MAFQLDPTGAVETLISFGSARRHFVATWDNLSPFTQGYIEAMFAASQPLNKIGKKLGAFMGAAGFSDLAPETLARIIADCDSLVDFYPGWNTRECGPLFWSTRQAGFREAFPPLTIQLGDDGKVRFA